VPREAALPGGSNGGTPPRKLSGEFGPTGQSSLRGVGGRILSDHAQLAVPIENPNHHTGTESKAETDRKVFLALRLNVWLRIRNDLARRGRKRRYAMSRRGESALSGDNDAPNLGLHPD
jgi:hypothetical protein